MAPGAGSGQDRLVLLAMGDFIVDGKNRLAHRISFIIFQEKIMVWQRLRKMMFVKYDLFPVLCQGLIYREN
jgi:hypothetical protein